MTKVTLTDLEKKVLRSMISDGFFFDDLTNTFIGWGVSGKAERGCMATLNTKGVINTFREDGDTYVNCGEGYTKHDIAEISGWNEILPWGEHYKVTEEDCK